MYVLTRTCWGQKEWFSSKPPRKETRRPWKVLRAASVRTVTALTIASWRLLTLEKNPGKLARALRCAAVDSAELTARAAQLHRLH